MVCLYNEITSGDGRGVCLKGWKVSGIKQAVETGLTNLRQLDPFEDIDPMSEGDADLKSIGPRSILEASKYVQEFENINNSDSEEELLDADDSDGDATRNIFEIFDDEEDVCFHISEF